MQDYFTSLEKQIQSAEARKDQAEVDRLRREYEEAQEGWRAQQRLELVAPREVGEAAPRLSTEEVDRLRELLTESKGAPASTLGAEGHFLRGNALYQTGDYDGAIQQYNYAIRLDPHYVGAYNNRGVAYRSKGQYDRALEDYDRALALNPENAPAYNNRGVAYAYKGQQDEAIEDYDRALELDPENASTYFNKACAYSHLQKLDGVTPNLSRAIELNGGVRETWKTHDHLEWARQFPEVRRLLGLG